MIVTRAAMDEYTAEVNAISEEAAQVAMAAYDEMRRSNPNASVAEVREGIIGIVESMVASYGGASSEIAAEVYDALAESAGADIEPAELDEEDEEQALLLKEMGLLTAMVEIFGIVSVPLIARYNGKRTGRGRGRLFYLFYPLHLLILYGISMLGKNMLA